MKIVATLTPQKLRRKTARVFELAGQKIRVIRMAQIHAASRGE